MQFFLSLLFLCVMCVQSNSIFFFLSDFLLTSDGWFSTLPYPMLMRYTRQPTDDFRLLIRWRRVLLEKLTNSQLVKKFPAYYRTLRFITALTKARHLTLSSARSCRTERSVEVRGTCIPFVIRPVFTVRSWWHFAQPPSWRTTLCRLYVTACSIYSQLPCILETVRPSATWGPCDRDPLIMEWFYIGMC